MKIKTFTLKLFKIFVLFTLHFRKIIYISHKKHNIMFNFQLFIFRQVWQIIMFDRNSID